MCFLSPLVWWEKVINVLQSKFNPEAALSKLLTVYLFWHPFISFLFHTPERLFLLYHYPKLTTLSDSSTNCSISSIVEIGQILLSSFYWRHLFILKKYFPLLPRSLILYQRGFRLVPIEIFDKLFSIRGVHPWLKWTNAALVKKWQSKGFKVNTWVANTEEEIKRCKEMGVDGIFTDDPRLARRILK